MSAESQSPPSQNRADPYIAPTTATAYSPDVQPRLAYRTAISRYKAARLAAIRLAQGPLPNGSHVRLSGNADEITEYLDQPSVIEALAARLDTGSRIALCSFALMDTALMPLAGLMHILGILGADPIESIIKLLDLGLLAIEPSADRGPVEDFQTVIARSSPARLLLRAHPAVTHASRTARLEIDPPKTAKSVRQIREADGLEPILRLGALWQRVGGEPLRLTHQDTLYKRDRDRIAEDTVLDGLISDGLKPLRGLTDLWLELACELGLLVRDRAAARLTAAPAEFWVENAVHLPQMIATAWIGLRTWLEFRATERDGSLETPAVPFLRLALLLYLSALDESDWAPLDELASQISERWPGWDRPSLDDQPIDRLATARPPGAPPGRAKGRASAPQMPRGVAVLETVLLGAAYPMGLVRAAEEEGSGRRLVQLTDQGRYVLAIGPAPRARETFDQFLFVQPNFEMIAYRQGLTPQLVGRLSQFAWWSQIGSALELKLTRESIVLGLDWGQTAETILDLLTKHSQRALPPGVTDAVKNWSTRRERVTYYAAATLIEFGSSSDRDAAIAFWPAGGPTPPIAVADRFLLVEEEKSVPFDRLRLTSSRDYRRPPEICAVVESDGVTLALDPGRSDLLVEAELARFADPLPLALSERSAVAASVHRRFIVTPESLRRGATRGMSLTQVVEWYSRRTGNDVPPAVKLLLVAKTSRIPPLHAERMLVLTLPTSVLVDGLLQHPVTSPLLGRRIGPFAVEIAEEKLAPLRKALKELGITLEDDHEKSRT